MLQAVIFHPLALSCAAVRGAERSSSVAVDLCLQKAVLTVGTSVTYSPLTAGSTALNPTREDSSRGLVISASQPGKLDAEYPRFMLSRTGEAGEK